MNGPIVGIMTSPKNEYSLAGNLNLFVSIEKELVARGARCFVFSYKDVKDDGRIIGYMYSTDRQKWHPTLMPLPNIVYNRIPFRHSEKTTQFQKCVQLFKNHQILMFNPGFIDKYELFLLLSSNKQLKKYLPKTILIDSMEKLEEFHNEHIDIYIKPRMLSKGKNVFRLNGDLVLESQNQKFSFSNFDSFWRKYGEIFSFEFIAQPAIHPAIQDGNRYDFRILSHWSETERNYLLTGIGIRATNQNNLTTHLVNGGIIIPYEKFRESKHDRFISDLVNKVGHVLSNKLGFFGEFSIDAGIDSDGNYVIYEVNSKPMSFDEEEIERKRVIQLCDLFLHLTRTED